MIYYTEFIDKVIDCAKNYKTLYIMGCIGAPMGYGRNRERYMHNNSYNEKPVRQKMIENASNDTFGFDCVCFVKSILGGWSGDLNKVYGGTIVKNVNGKLVYGEDYIPDYSTEGMINACYDVSSDFTNIQAGELLWLSGHVGVYIGDGLTVECTPAWKNKVQFSVCGNVSNKTTYPVRRWSKHGKLPWVKYGSEPTPKPIPTEPNYSLLPIVRYGMKDDVVKVVQCAVNTDIDGEFGKNTLASVKDFQTKHKLVADGVVGKDTWKAILS